MKETIKNKNIQSFFLVVAVLFPFGAHALEMTAYASGQAAGSSDNGSIANTATQDEVAVAISGSSTAGHSFFAEALGNEDGVFSAATFGSGTFSAYSEYNYYDEITNTPTAEQFYSYTFNVLAGGIFTTPEEDSSVAFGFTNNASMRFLVYFDNRVIYDESMQLLKIGTNYTSRVDENGFYYQNSHYILESDFVGHVWEDFSFSLDLGMIGAGQSASLRYQLISQAESNHAFPGESSVGALIGDPAGLNELPSRLPFNQLKVSEPSKVVLFVFGFAGLGWTRRATAT